MVYNHVVVMNTFTQLNSLRNLKFEHCNKPMTSIIFILEIQCQLVANRYDIIRCLIL